MHAKWKKLVSEVSVLQSMQLYHAMTTWRICTVDRSRNVDVLSSSTEGSCSCEESHDVDMN